MNYQYACPNNSLIALLLLQLDTASNVVPVLYYCVSHIRIQSSQLSSINVDPQTRRGKKKEKRKKPLGLYWMLVLLAVASCSLLYIRRTAT